MKEKFKRLFQRGKVLAGASAVAVTSAMTAVCASAETVEATTATGVLSSATSQASNILTFLGDLTAFVIGNELCMCFLGFMFISRGVGVLKRCLRVTPR